MQKINISLATKNYRNYYFLKLAKIIKSWNFLSFSFFQHSLFFLSKIVIFLILFCVVSFRQMCKSSTANTYNCKLCCKTQTLHCLKLCYHSKISVKLDAFLKTQNCSNILISSSKFSMDLLLRINAFCK